MSDDRPQILKLTWRFVFGLMAIEAASFALVLGLYWFAANYIQSRMAATNIRSLLDDQAAAWNRGDLEGYMAGYWKDENLRFFGGGDVTTGWQPTLDRYRRRYQGEGKAMGKLTFSEVEITPLAHDAATARGHWKLDFPDGKASEGLFTLVLRRFGYSWRIVHDHSSSKPP